MVWGRVFLFSVLCPPFISNTSLVHFLLNTNPHSLAAPGKQVQFDLDYRNGISGTSAHPKAGRESRLHELALSHSLRRDSSRGSQLVSLLINPIRCYLLISMFDLVFCIWLMICVYLCSMLTGFVKFVVLCLLDLCWAILIGDLC